MYSCRLLLISSASVRFLIFLFFIVPIFVRNVPLVSPILLKRSLDFPIQLFSSLLCILHLRRLYYLLAILCGTVFSWVYLTFSPLPLTSLLFSAIREASSDNHFAFLHFFFFVTASWTVLQTSIHSSSGTLSSRSDWSLESICHFHCVIVRDLI